LTSGQGVVYPAPTPNKKGGKMESEITIYYTDLLKVSKIIGILIEQTNYAITIRTPNKKIVTIPMSKIVRIESEET